MLRNKKVLIFTMIVVVLLTLSVISAEDTTNTNKITKKSVEKSVTQAKTTDKNIKTTIKESTNSKNVKSSKKTNVSKNIRKTNKTKAKSLSQSSVDTKSNLVKTEKTDQTDTDKLKLQENLLNKNSQKSTKQETDITTKEEITIIDSYNTNYGLPYFMSNGGVGFCLNANLRADVSTKYTSEKNYKIINRTGQDVQQYIKVLLIQNYNKGYFADNSKKLQGIIWAFTDWGINSDMMRSGCNENGFDYNQMRIAYYKTISDSSKYNRIGDRYIETVDGTTYVYEFHLLKPTTSGQSLLSVNYYELKDYDLKISKEWIDHDNVDKLRPDEINFSLYRKVKVTYNNDLKYENNYYVDKIQLTKANNWNAHYHLDAPDINTIKNVPYRQSNYRTYKFDYEYYLIEDSINDYTSENHKNYFNFNNNQASVTVINTHIVSDKINLTVTKKWSDNPNQQMLRPSEIKVKLLANDVIVHNYTIKEENGWVLNVNELERFNEDGSLVNYRFVEEVPKHYTVSYSNEDNHYTITNTVISKINITVTKKWSDYHNHPSLRPSEIKVTLYAGDDKIHTYHLNEKNDWKLTISNLERFNDDGSEIKYKFLEEVPEHYTVSYSHEDNHYTILNTLKSEINITGTKTWVDGNKHHNNAKEVHLTLTRSIGNKTTKVDETPTWHGNTYSYTNLPKYNHNGEEYIYQVTETPVPGYDNPVYDGYDITNVKTAKYINISVTKVWKNNHEKIPNNITVNLLCNHEAIESVILSKENNWKHTFINLQQHDSDYNVLEYIVDEIIVPEGYDADYSGDMFSGFVITNTYQSKDNETKSEEPVKETVNIKVRKVWITHGYKKPKSITVDLKVGDHHIATATLSSKNNWKYTFKNLDKYDENGKLIEYSVDEVIIEENYHVKYTGNMNDGFVITNEYKHVEPKVKTVNVTVTKKWKNNIVSVNDSVSVSLFANGQHVASTTLSHENNWTHTFTLLPKYNKKGKAIKYEVSEVIVPENFIAHYSGNMKKGFLITNEYINPVNKTLEEEKNITVHKKNKTEHKENITFENETELIHFKWGWELINMSKYFELYGDDNVTGNYVDNNQTNNDYPATNPNNKASLNNNNNQNSNSIGINSANTGNSPNYRYNRYYNNYRRYNNNYYRRSYSPGYYYPSYNYADSGKGYKYHLYIYLYEEYILGHMSYQDFIAALEHEGIDILHHHTHWDENGVLVVDYETLDDVPHTINLKDSQGHIEDSNAKIDKSGANSKDHVIDSGEVTAKHTEKSKQKASLNKQTKKVSNKNTNTKKSSSTNKKSSKSNAKSSNSNNKVSSTK